MSTRPTVFAGQLPWWLRINFGKLYNFSSGKAIPGKDACCLRLQYTRSSAHSSAHHNVDGLHHGAHLHLRLASSPIWLPGWGCCPWSCVRPFSLHSRRILCSLRGPNRSEIPEGFAFPLPISDSNTTSFSMVKESRKPLHDKLLMPMLQPHPPSVGQHPHITICAEEEDCLGLS